MTEETYNLDKDMVWGQVGKINKILENEGIKNSDKSFLHGMLRVWLCVIENGENPPDVTFPVYKR